MKIATRESWKTVKPLPEKRAKLAYSRTFDAAEHARIVRGLVPEQMEDKWFVFWEEPWLWFHRSWTGIAIYGVRLEGTTVKEAWVNRAPEEYAATDDAHDAAILAFLVDRLLLGRDVPFPVRASFPEAKRDLLVHVVVGRGKTNDDDSN